MRGVKCQVWLTEDGRPVLGEDLAELLAAVRDRGSMVEAAEAAGISYRYAWSRLRALEKEAGVKVVASHRGGSRRGSSALTPEGMALLQEFENKMRRVDEQLVRMFKNPVLTADGIVVINGKVVLIRRGNDPAKGRYALPGGFVEYGERLEECVVREVLEETGLRTEVLDLVGVYSDPDRDPRGHIITAVFSLRARGGELKAGDDADGVGLHDLDALPELAFDHRRMISDLMDRKGRHLG